MDKQLYGLKMGNASFMMRAAEYIGTDDEFVHSLKRAADPYIYNDFNSNLPEIYPNMQKDSQGGIITIDMLVADQILSKLSLYSNYGQNLLFEFKTKAHERNPEMYKKDDQSILLISFDRHYPSFEIGLEIVEYTDPEDFEPVTEPLKAFNPFNLERTAKLLFQDKSKE